MKFHDFEALDIHGNLVSMKQFAGKKLLVVNTASECGYTDQYALLQELYDQFGGEEIEILAFPCNQFGGQEPGSSEEIAAFCSTEFGVAFPLFEKVNVIGAKAHPIFKWLQSKEQNGKSDYKITWNFWKFLVNEHGELINAYGSATLPVSEEIMQWITQPSLF
jgi:glutathione peroxidase